MAEQDHVINLRDGRDLAYTDHGAKSGTPVLFIHGNPGSRLSRHPDETIAENLGVRLITPDRPGYGLSDFQPKRTLLDFPKDIAELADRLGLTNFAIFGVSAGGPYVAACAYTLSERITQAANVSGLAPIDRAGAFEGMDPAWRAAYTLSDRSPEFLLRAILWLQARATKRNPTKALDRMRGLLSEDDNRLLEQPDMQESVLKRQTEATRMGVRGWAREAKILISPWGFSPQEIKIPVHLWYWEDDPSIPIQMGRYLATQIPLAVPHFMPGGGHLSMYCHWAEILTHLMTDPGR
jgi:pimeloyl-ACP methyl ester carboxylesterase